MAEVDTVNGVAIADIDTINGTAAADIETISGVDFVTGFRNKYSLRQLDASQEGSVEIANPNSYHFESGGTDEAFSISAWVNGGDSPPKRFRVASKGHGAYDEEETAQEWYLTTGDPPWYDPTANPPIDFKLFGNAAGSIYIERHGGAVAISGSWNHLVATYDGSGKADNIKFYLNGSDITSTTNTFSAGTWSALNDSEAPVIIGGIAGNSDRFKGYLDEVSIWSKELSSEDVTTIYNGGTANDISGLSSLLSWWRMGDNNGGTGTTVTDVEGVGDGTLSGFAASDGFSSETVP